MKSKISKSKANKTTSTSESSSVNSMNRYNNADVMVMNSSTSTSKTDKSTRRTSEIDILCELVIRYINNKITNMKRNSSSIKTRTTNSSDAKTMKSCTDMNSMC